MRLTDCKRMGTNMKMSDTTGLTPNSTADDFRTAAQILIQNKLSAEADNVLRLGVGRFPDNPGLLIDYMKRAEDAGDWEEAYKRCCLAQACSERTPFLFARASLYLRKQRRYDDADEVLKEGQLSFPSDLAMYVDHARIAEEKADWMEAVARYEVVREHFPNSWYGFGRGAAALRQIGRLDEAEALLVQGQDQHPALEIMFVDYAKISEARRDWPEALRRYGEVISRFPESWFGFAGEFRVLRNTWRLEDAELVLIDALSKLPNDPRPLLELVMFLPRISSDKRRISLHDLEARIVGYLQRSVPTVQLLEARAHLVRLSGNYDMYLTHLLDAQRRFPAEISIQKNIAIARELLLGQEQHDHRSAIDKGHSAPSGGALDAEDRIKSILSRFESLGGGGDMSGSVYGCEFGFIQRSFGVESLSLLRWSSIHLHDLTRAAEDGFVRAGQEESVVIRALGGSDWGMVDTNYGIFCDHTHLDRSSVSQIEAKAMMCQRTARLGRKLIEDFEDAEKIFVYRQSGQKMDYKDVLALAASVNKWGPNTLLYVAHSDAANPPFSIRQVHKGLILGFLDWFSPDRGCTEWNTKGWTTLCINAFNLIGEPRLSTTALATSGAGAKA